MDVASGSGGPELLSEDPKVAKLRNSTAKMLETQSLVSALLLGVSSGGLFAQPGLELGFLKTSGTILYCVSMFCFLSATIMSAAYLIPIRNERMDPHMTLKDLSGVFFMPLYYFFAGYICMVAGTTAFFLNMGIGHEHTFSCLAFCSAFMIGPTLYTLAKIVRMMPTSSHAYDDLARVHDDVGREE